MKFLLDHDVPDGLSYLIEHLGPDVTLLRKCLPVDSTDEAVLQFAHDHGFLLLSCNRDDFLQLATTRPHHGIVIVIRVEPARKNGLRCFGCWNALATPAF